MAALMIGTGAGILTWLASHGAAAAVLAGGTAYGAAVNFLNTVIS